MIGVVRAIIALFYSAFWCGFAVVYLIIFPNKKDYLLLNVGKKWWSTYMLKWIIGSKIEVSIPDETKDLFANNADIEPKTEQKADKNEQKLEKTGKKEHKLIKKPPPKPRRRRKSSGFVANY